MPEGRTGRTASPALAAAVRERLGLPVDASVATIQAALNERLNPPAAAPADLPDGVVTIDRTVLAQLQRDAAASAEALAATNRQHRDRAISVAIQAGKITPARRKAYETLWDSDPVGAEQTLASLAPGLALPLGMPKGYPGGDEAATADDALYRRMFPNG